VKVLDGFNRFRFATEPDLLAAWTAACNVIGPPHPTEKPVVTAGPGTGDQIQPAA
jgi:hypothetical protein